MKGFISLIVGLLVTALALTYALWDVDVAEFSALFRSANYWVIAPFLGLLTAHFWLKALRWVAILRPLGRFTPAQVTPAMMIGFGANNVVPAHLGELLRTVVFARRFGKPYSGVLASLVLERIFDVTAILLLYLFAASITRPPTEVLTSVVLIAAGMTAGAFAVILFVLWKPHRVLSMWNRVARWLPAHLQERGETVLQNVVLALSSLKAPGLLIVLLGNSLLQWTLAAGNIWLAMWAFGLTISASVTVIALAVTALAVTVPSAPGYIGPIQAAFVLALVPFGVTQEAALAGSIFFLAVQWVPVTAIGAVFFASAGLRLAEVRQEVEKLEHHQGAVSHSTEYLRDQ